MYFKIALKNVKKSYKDYFVYFVTLTISVSLFYLFNSFDAQQEILVAGQDVIFAFNTLKVGMEVISYLVTIVFGFLILYANNFIMKRRKKEIALYTLLGMKKSKISRIMVYETLFVGLLSLFTGISLGIILSQGVAALTAKILEVQIDYHFIISFDAIISTFINFSIIFAIVGIFNNLFMSKAKLVDLFKAKVTNEVQIVKNPIIMTIIMLVSLITLGLTYRFIQEPMFLIIFLLPVLLVGSLATYTLFYALSYWFVKISVMLKNYYYKDLNAFTTRQISSKISSTYKLLASVSLMLLLSFGSLATSFNIQGILNRMFNQPGDYDISLAYHKVNDGKDFDKDLLQFDENYTVSYVVEYTTGLNTDSISRDDLFDFENSPLKAYPFEITLISEDDYNAYQDRAGKQMVDLKDDEIIYFIPDSVFVTTNERHQFLNDEITLLNRKLSVLNHDNNFSNLGGYSNFNFTIVANMKTIENLQSEISNLTPGLNTLITNIDFAEDQDLQTESDNVYNVLNKASKDGLLEFGYQFSSRIDNLKSAREVTLLITYLGLYIGLTFIVVCVMLISLQLLSAASDNYERYLLLDKIGVSDKLQKRSIFKQNLIYFALPLIVALIHSYVGIKAVNMNMALGGLVTDSYAMILIAILILVLIYLLYFLVTYYSSVRMIFDRKKH